jgi:ABC-type antimicrobial peptide transport system permease subunit
MVRVVKNMLGEQDPSASVDASTMSERLKPLIFPSKAGALLLGVLAGVGLTLSLIGFYGVMSFAINQRTFEIAVRIALGATPGRIIRLILRDGFVLVGFGLAVGIVLSLFATTLLRSLLAFGLSTADPISFTMAIIGFIFAGICINLLVTRRAIAVDPIISLRCVR